MINMTLRYTNPKRRALRLQKICRMLGIASSNTKDKSEHDRITTNKEGAE